MKIRIIAPSDGEQHEVWWADYWVKKDLESAFTSHGHTIIRDNPDLDFFLFGNPSRFSSMTAPLKFCWLYSHPNKFRQTFASHFDHIFSLSSALLPHLPNSSLLLPASSKHFTPRVDPPQYDLVFIGNAFKPKRTELLKHLIQLKKYKICLVGVGWPSVLPDLIHLVDYKGPYIANPLIGQFLNLGMLSFYSAHEDMRLLGFVAVRILDTFRSSENLCISDANFGLKDIFRRIPTYSTKEHLASHIDWFLKHPNRLEKWAIRCRHDAQPWTFSRAVTEIEKWL